MLRFYIDDSGSRLPDRSPRDQPVQHDWFALGGVLIAEGEVDTAHRSIASFRSRWPEMGQAPLHSYCIRNNTGYFRWLTTASSSARARFMNELTELITNLPIVVSACVIDRPGYNARYREQYGRERWSLCKTAFTIAVERSAKYAAVHGHRLRVFVENSDRKTEQRLRGYYEELRVKGPPFDASRSAKYAPLDAGQLASTLLEFRVKSKESELMQIADLALWPVCKAGYNPATMAFLALRESGKLIDARCTAENGLHGIKYSCFDAAAHQKNESPLEAGSRAATDTTGG